MGNSAIALSCDCLQLLVTMSLKKYLDYICMNLCWNCHCTIIFPPHGSLIMTWCFQHAPSKEAIPYDQYDCLGSSPYETEEMKEGKIWRVTYAVENKSLTGTKDKKVPAPAPGHAPVPVSVPAPSPAPSPAPAGCKGFRHGLDKWRSEEANPSWSSHWRRKSPGGKLSSPSPLSSSPLLPNSVYNHH